MIMMMTIDDDVDDIVDNKVEMTTRKTMLMIMTY